MIAPDTLLQNRYLVREQIGRGGMGAVYIATDQRFGSTVAIKETFFDDPSLRRAFEREARLLNHLRHHALPRVSDHFQEEEGQFLVMEYIPGDDLSDMLQKRGSAFPLSDVLAWADQLLDALDYLHTQEMPVIHRDIKPQNLKLTARGQIVLLDFGLAKGTASQSRVTATGSVFGYSRNYAPLEQMHGTGTDPRSDLYSLAATLYHLATGEIPPDALSRATAVLNAQPDPLRTADEVNTQVPAPVAEVLARAMSQSAAARPQTAEEMRALLREAARDSEGARELDGARVASAASTVINAANAAPTAANVHDQETRILDGTARGGARSTVAGGDGRTQHAGAQDGATVANAPTRIAEQLTETAARLTGAASTASNAAGSPSASADSSAAAADSIVTRVAPPHSSAAPPPHASAAAAPRRGLSGRTLGALASVVLLVGVAGAYYAYTSRPSATKNTPPVAAESPSAVPSPDAAQPPATSTSEPAKESAGESAPTTTVIIKKSPDPAPKGAKQQQPGASGDPEGQHLDAPEVVAPVVVAPDINIPDIPESELRGVDWNNPVARERAMRRIRRLVRQRQLEAERVRRQTEAQQPRRRQQQQPVAPAPPPDNRP
ncbi:MAG TPA: protein kinase [Pyrinomonadaceae bacterium]|nr:protein kinase [Pyrinomonadaceae bacterium]